jgi:hypothetical protein
MTMAVGKSVCTGEQESLKVFNKYQTIVHASRLPSGWLWDESNSILRSHPFLAFDTLQK